LWKQLSQSVAVAECWERWQPQVEAPDGTSPLRLELFPGRLAYAIGIMCKDPLREIDMGTVDVDCSPARACLSDVILDISTEKGV
jgi:hypothetical protein